ncbi:C40 family peptidase [Hyphobacterium marinum]|uniref:NlpC/P60 family protein n=1 Tax=Hyphobacterium marinum TaxID=3116574 RepID=A0ABU7LWE6_9PROT|nr:NlpC/P60 family protein [Hyphobacterium sp. Y6023]MEE2565801.1 NlpC/P60 family protein [Hyphobacterium sp. Y6023]
MGVHQVITGVAALRREPRADGPLDTQLLFGETFVVDEARRGWLHGRAEMDGYEGWVADTDLTPDVSPASHRVRALRTYVYSRPDLKSEPVHLISMNARVEAGERDGNYLQVQGGGWVHQRHLAALNAFEPDFVAVAERFAGTPYLWGGRDSRGLDCSGLVQTAFAAAGMPVPRDSGDQETFFAERWDRVDPASRKQRGDLVFWPGHVGIMVDETGLLHANAGYMETMVEPIDDAVARIMPGEGPVRTLVRRTLP